MTNAPNIVAYNLDDYQKHAKLVLSRKFYEYLASGTDDEQTLRENISSFKMWYLRPRVLRSVAKLSTVTNLFGQHLDFPVFVSPAGLHALCDPEHGECSTARACGRKGIQTIFGLSQHATRSIEEVAKAAPESNLWYQVYLLKDRELTVRLLMRAIRARYKGIFLTADSVKFGYREADARNGFDALPPPHRLVNYDEVGTRKSKLEATYNGKTEKAWDQNSQLMFKQDPTWKDVKWLKRHCNGLPLVIKGIMTAEDARLAVENGADGILVSNHGGRGLDASLPSIDVLPEVAKAVYGRVPVLLDGGIRRGTDVLKALALGASAVGLGKPVFFALSVKGEEGVVEMMRLLKRELEAAMAICGVETVQDIQPSLVTRHPSGGAVPNFIRASL